MSRFWAWWNTRAAVGGVGFVLLRLAIAVAIPIVLVLVLAFVAQGIISGH